MKILDLEQRSDEWLDFRLGKVSGSKAKDYSSARYISKQELINFAESKGYTFPKNLTIDNIRSLMTDDENDELNATVKLNDSIYELIAEKIARPINPNDYADRLGGRPYSPAVRGELLEHDALEAVNRRLGKSFVAGQVWISDDNDNMMYSADGQLVDSDGKIREALEIKCLSAAQQIKAYYEHEPPKKYRPQIIQSFVVNENLETLYFAMYSDQFALAPRLELLIFDIHRKDIEREIRTVKAVESNIIKLVNQCVDELTF